MQLELQEIGGTLRLINPLTGEILKSYDEMEQENARLRAEIEKLRGKQD
jgi:hypothetical protein